MGERHPIVDTAAALIDRAAVAYGRYKEDEFSQFMRELCLEIESPIEQLFMVAINLVAEFNYTQPSIASEFRDDIDDLLIIPQWRVGKYRVDFALRWPAVGRIVCVELDGHEFHDRDERERRYEKARDRFLTTAGYRFLHFTGTEVVKDPCAVALEAFNLATGLPLVGIHPLQQT